MDYLLAIFLQLAFIKIADAVTVLLVWNLVWFLRFNSALFPVWKGMPMVATYDEGVKLLVVTFLVIFHVVGAYRKDRVPFGFKAFKKIIQGSILSMMAFLSVSYFMGQAHYSRLFLLLYLGLVIPAIIIERVILEVAWGYIQKNWVRRMRILLIGYGELMEFYIHELKTHMPYPLQLIGRISDKEIHSDFKKIPVLGEEKDLSQLVAPLKVDFAVVSYPTEESHRLENVLRHLSQEPFMVKVLPDFGRYNTFRYTAQQEVGIPLLEFNRPPYSASDRVLKRWLDALGAFILLIVFSPIFLAISLWIKLTSKGPIFYSQTRQGMDGKLFTLYKFRTMEINAEAKTGAVWAQENDPRTTQLGKWLRKTSLDEIPQFYNVLIGDMSLVGPRPERPVFVDKFKKEVPKYMLRHRMKSGITGWAQINGWRGNTSIDERIKYDLFYIQNWSHYFDIKILCLTLWKGFVHRHAY